MPTNVLTDSRCKAAQPGDKPYKLSDGGGLQLYITAQGSKLWRLAYRYDGKQKQMSFGAYPAVSLAEARTKRESAKAQLREGTDPMAAIKTAKPTPKTVTFADAYRTYWQGRKDLSARYISNAHRAFEMHLKPALGNRPIGSITRADLMAEFSRMDVAGLHVYVRKTRMWAGQVFDWAVEHEHAAINPCALIDPRKAFGHSPVENFAALRLAEIPELAQRLSMEGDLQSALACRFLAYTWVRTNEMRMLEWSELTGNIWTIPAGKMKRRREHIVPLPTQAVEILQKMKARNRGGRFVFEADHRPDRPISENSVLYLLWRMGYRGRMTGHGWRTVASTWANENGYPADAIERQLAHAPDDKIRAVYNRAEYMPQRTQMIQAWADWLDAATAGL